MKDYDKLRAMLEDQESFPLRFTYKFIGRNSDAFTAAVEALEKAFPDLQLEITRQSSGGAHVAKTYLFVAPDADAIIEIYRAIERIDDLMVVL